MHHMESEKKDEKLVQLNVQIEQQQLERDNDEVKHQLNEKVAELEEQTRNMTIYKTSIEGKLENQKQVESDNASIKR